MSLSERIAAVRPNPRNNGCQTCVWLRSLDQNDRDSMLHWVSDGNSVMQLYDICTSDPDNPLRVSYTAFRNHLKACREPK